MTCSRMPRPEHGALPELHSQDRNFDARCRTPSSSALTNSGSGLAVEAAPLRTQAMLKTVIEEC
jgi:hypothetical protein